VFHEACTDVEPLGPDRAGRPDPSRRSCRTPRRAGHDPSPPPPGSTRRLTMDADKGRRQGLRRRGVRRRLAQRLCDPACRTEITPFSDRRPHDPTQGLCPLDQAPKADRLASEKRSPGSLSDPPHLRLGKNHRRHGPDRLSRRRVPAVPLHPDNGSQQPCPIDNLARLPRLLAT